MIEVLSHYDAITSRLNREKDRVVSAKNDNEKTWWNHRVMMTEKELAGEIEFLKKHHGIDMSPVSNDIMSDDELLKELGV